MYVSSDLTLGSTEVTSKAFMIYPLAFKDSLSVDKGSFTLSHNLVIIFSLT